jgi:hypothetical protein
VEGVLSRKLISMASLRQGAAREAVVSPSKQLIFNENTQPIRPVKSSSLRFLEEARRREPDRAIGAGVALDPMAKPTHIMG